MIYRFLPYILLLSICPNIMALQEADSRATGTLSATETTSASLQEFYTTLYQANLDLSAWTEYINKTKFNMVELCHVMSALLYDGQLKILSILLTTYIARDNYADCINAMTSVFDMQTQSYIRGHKGCLNNIIAHHLEMPFLVDCIVKSSTILSILNYSTLVGKFAIFNGMIELHAKLNKLSYSPKANNIEDIHSDTHQYYFVGILNEAAKNIMSLQNISSNDIKQHYIDYLQGILVITTAYLCVLLPADEGYSIIDRIVPSNKEKFTHFLDIHTKYRNDPSKYIPPHIALHSKYKKLIAIAKQKDGPNMIEAMHNSAFA